MQQGLDTAQLAPAAKLSVRVAHSARDIRRAFLAEAAMLSAVGAVVGYLLGQAGAFALRQAFPVFPAYPPDWAVIAGLATALGTGLLFGVMPARRAARLDPVQALMKH